jgi:fibronectin-binding autotransporter adhesin
MKKNTKLSTGNVFTVIYLILFSSVHAVTVTWDAGANSTWDTTTSNWTATTYTNGDDAQFLGSGAGTVTLSGTITPNSVLVNSSNDYTFAGSALQSSSTINKTGTGTLTLTTAGNTATDISAAGGNLVLSGTSTTTASGYVYAANSGIAGGGSGTLTVQDSATLTATGLQVGNQSGTTGTVNQTGGTVNLTGAGANDVRVGHWAGSGSYTISGGILNTLNTNFIVGWDGVGTFNVDGGVANVKGVRLGANTNVGTLNLDGGTLNIGSSGITQNQASTINLDSGTLGSLAGWSSSLGMNLGGAVDIDTTGGDISLSGALAGAGGFTKTGTGTLTLSGAGASTYTGATAVDNGTLRLSGDLTFGTGRLANTSAITVASGAELEVAGAYNTSWNGEVVLNGGTLNYSHGTLENYLNTITLNDGAEITGTGQRIGWQSNGSITVGGTSASTISSEIQLVNGGSPFATQREIAFNVADVTSDAGTDLTVSGTLSDFATTGAYSGATLVKNGAGTMELTTTNTYTGATVVNDGTLKLNAGGLAFNEGVLQDTSSITVNSGATLDVANTGNIKDTTAIVLDGGTLHLSAGTVGGGPGANYTNNLTLNSGAQVTGATADDGVRLGYLNNATITVGGSSASSINTDVMLVNNTGGRSVTFDVADASSSAASDLTISGNIIDFGGGGLTNAPLVKTGVGTLTLSGTNTYTGTTTVDTGTLIIDGIQSGATGAMTINVNGTLAGSGTIGASLLTVNGVIAPGNSPGTLATGSQLWNDGGAYLWEINDSDGSKGLSPGGTNGWDWLDITGDLNLANLSAGGFTIDIDSLNSSDLTGTADGFDYSGLAYGDAFASTFIIATANNITGFESGDFILDDSGFVNGKLEWSINLDDGVADSLVLSAVFVPEPSSTALLGLGSLALLMRRKRS